MDLEIEEAWYGYNMWEHVEYRFVPEKLRTGNESF